MAHVQCEISGRDSALCWVITSGWQNEGFPQRVLFFFYGSWNLLRPKAKATKVTMIDFSLWYRKFTANSQGSAKAHIVTTPLLATEDQQPLGPKRGILLEKRFNWFAPASVASRQSANLKKPTRRPSKARILFKLGGRTNMLAWKKLLQNHLCVAHFHLAFRRFQNLVCLPHMARKNAVPIFNFVQNCR